MIKTKVVGKSLGEIEVLTYIQTIYQGEIISGYTHPKAGKKELDIYLPDVQIGFEYNGAFWHSTAFKGRNDHLDKQNLYKELGVQVYFLDAADWENSARKPILQARIAYILGALDTSIYARKTEVVYPTVAQEKEFLTQNHIQGYAISTYRVGLQYEGDLVALLSFSKRRINTNSRGAEAETTLELLRYATSISSRVVGGLSKLLRTAQVDLLEQYPNVEKIITYSDNSLSVGNMYERVGFKYLRTAAPSYYYVLNGKKYNRYTFRKSVLKERFPTYYDENLSETQIVDRIPNLHRIWNVGNRVYELDLTEPLTVPSKQTKETTRTLPLRKVSYQENLENLSGRPLPENSTLSTELQLEDGSLSTVGELLVSQYLSEHSDIRNKNRLFQRWLDDRFGKGTYQLLGNFHSFSRLVTILDVDHQIRKRTYPKSLTTNGKFKVTDMFERIEEKYEGRFQPVMEGYVDGDTPMDFIDTLYDNEILRSTPRGLLRRKNTPGAPSKISSFKRKVKELYGDEYEVLADQIDSMEDPIEIYSKSLNETRLISPHNFLSNGGFKRSRLKKGAEVFDSRLAEHGYKRIAPFTGLRGITKVQHLETGNIIEGTGNAIKLRLKKLEK